jgi:RHS repeat-associated protein
LQARGDAGHSDATDFNDYNAILGAWNKPIGHADYAASIDLDHSGLIDFNDISVLLAAWGSTEAVGTGAPASRPCSIAYIGALWDPVAQMSLMRNRWQDPTLGRFITRDPAGYVDGMSLYLYSRGNPLGWWDPWGLKPAPCDVRSLESEYDSVRGPGNHEPNTLTESEKEAGREGDKARAEFFRRQGKQLLKDAGKAAIGVVIIVSPADEVLVGSVFAKYGARAANRVLNAIVDAVKKGKSSKEVSEIAAKSAAKEAAAATKANPNTEPGSYTNVHESGKKYHGKGDAARAKESAKRVENQSGDPHVTTDHAPSSSHREAFKEEQRRLERDGGPKNPDNYNKINSPGKKYQEEDGDLSMGSTGVNHGDRGHSERLNWRCAATIEGRWRRSAAAIDDRFSHRSS